MVQLLLLSEKIVRININSSIKINNISFKYTGTFLLSKKIEFTHHNL